MPFFRFRLGGIWLIVKRFQQFYTIFLHVMQLSSHCLYKNSITSEDGRKIGDNYGNKSLEKCLGVICF